MFHFLKRPQPELDDPSVKVSLFDEFANKHFWDPLSTENAAIHLLLFLLFDVFGK